MDQVLPRPDRLARVGDWLRQHQGTIRAVQWAMIAAYVVLVVVPPFLPLPTSASTILSDFVLFAQFLFWGIWWPAVLVSTMIVGRAWCGFFCPEGALTEFASRHGRGRAIPRWVTWPGWPFAAFAATTVYGQMVSVYQYPAPALLVLGGSTLAAIAVGLSFGRGKRVWCRYLCPVNGVFRLLARLAPLHYAVDGEAWKWSQAQPRRPLPPVNCAPLVPLRTMRGGAACHMCGRCSGFRGAIRLAARSPSREIIAVAGDAPDPFETWLLLFGLNGIALGAFHWSVSPWFVALKQAVATWLVGHGWLWPLRMSAPWWLLTDYPEHNDILTLCDGALLVAYIAATALVVGTVTAAILALATSALGRWSSRRFHHLALALTPIGGAGVVLGLSSLSVTMLRAEGILLPYVQTVRALVLVAASLWSLRLAAGIAARYAAAPWRRALAVASVGAALTVVNAGWFVLFFVW